MSTTRNAPPTSMVTEQEAKKKAIKWFLNKIPELSSHLMCPICHDHNLLPVILECGHSSCQSCNKRLDDMDREERQEKKTDKAKQCSLCRASLIGPAYPSFQLKALSSAINILQEYHNALQTSATDNDNTPQLSSLLTTALIEAITAVATVLAGGTTTTNGMSNDPVIFEHTSKAEKDLIHLQLKVLDQVELAKHAARILLLRLSPQHLTDGIYVLFDQSTTHRFVYAFGVELHQVYHCHVQYDNDTVSMLVRYNIVAMHSVTVLIQPPPVDDATPQQQPQQQQPLRYALPAPQCPVQNRVRFYLVVNNARVIITELPRNAGVVTPPPSTPAATSTSISSTSASSASPHKQESPSSSSSSLPIHSGGGGGGTPTMATSSHSMFQSNESRPAESSTTMIEEKTENRTPTMNTR